MLVSPVSCAVVLGVTLLLIGPKRIPALGRAIGKTIRNFRSGLNDQSENDAGDAQPMSDRAVVDNGDSAKREQ